MAKSLHENDYLSVTLNDKGYVRILQKTGGVVIIPMLGEKFILIEHQRGNEVLLEFPRGFLEADESHHEGGLRELKEELNLDAVSHSILGELRTDSGLIRDNIVAVKCRLNSLDGIALQHSEGVLAWRELTFSEVLNEVKSGGIKDNFTLASLMLLVAQKD
ncbi:NUDIX domain-containing protein [Siccibacter colletis]|uniref:NUDIX hydrolase n=1 Tax=Siccibacter colletis TaxID=1505757 RepID=UPI0028BF25A4|nr:NUDIX domain-containing protein [Siccibacter colletis]WNN46808.1 NUDIX domain-containing protein [Siccibacter colletis]